MSTLELIGWEGYRLVWHLWDCLQPAYLVTHEQYIRRILYIYKETPKEQIEQRFRNIAFVKAPFDTSELNDRLRAALVAEAALSKANTTNDNQFACPGDANAYRDNAFGDWALAELAWLDCYNAFCRDNAAAIEQAHAKECGCSALGR